MWACAGSKNYGRWAPPPWVATRPTLKQVSSLDGLYHSQFGRRRSDVICVRSHPLPHPHKKEMKQGPWVPAFKGQSWSSEVTRLYGERFPVSDALGRFVRGHCHYWFGAIRAVIRIFLFLLVLEIFNIFGKYFTDKRLRLLEFCFFVYPCTRLA